MTPSRSIPLPALPLGWSGVIPFAGLTGAALAGFALPVPAVSALVAYSAAILSFMGGAQWGMATRAGDGVDRRWPGYAISVIPALVGWVALLVPAKTALVLLIVGFGALHAYDLWTVRRGIAPGWYGALRVQLTAAAVALLAVMLVAL